jgi:ABC-type transport system involved in cytochrome c biogenesis ATPase subunit
MSLEAFVAMIERERPETLSPSDLAAVRPQPWFLRAGSGKSARIRMLIGSVRYQRDQGEVLWRRSTRADDLDVDEAA